MGICPTHCPPKSSGGLYLGSLAGLITDGMKMTKTKETAAPAVTEHRPWRHPMFWGFCVPMLPFALWAELHWWTVVIAAVLAAAAGAGAVVIRVLHRLVVQARPEPTHEMRAALTARGLRTIPAPVQVARPALPRAVVRSLTGRRQALPAPARALPGVVTGKVVPAPVRKVGG